MILKIKDLTFKYRKKIILKNLNYEFSGNKIYGLLGKNGVGKTTLLNILKGKYSYLGEITLDDGILYSYNVTFISSIPELPEFLTGKEYIKYLMKLNKIDEEHRIDDYFKLVKLDISDEDKMLIDYSHGMKNKIEILSSIILNSKIILLDEPLTNLDIPAQEEIKEILNTLKKNKIIIISTHILDIASSICDEIIILKDKKIHNTSNNRTDIINSLKDDINN